MCCYKHYAGHKRFKECLSVALFGGKALKKKVCIMETFVVELGNRKIPLFAGTRFTMNNSSETISSAC